MTDADDEVASWIAAGTPPIFFGFGSTPLSKSPADTIGMMVAACAQLGERALVCSGETDFSGIPQFDHVKVVSAVNYAAIFPACRAVVHHGGSGTTAASLRRSTHADPLDDGRSAVLGSYGQTIEGGHHPAHFDHHPKVAGRGPAPDPRPAILTRARQIATRITKPAESVANAADVLEISPASGVLPDRRRRAGGMIGAGQVWQITSAWVAGIAAGLEKLATATRQDRSPRAGVSARHTVQ